MEGKTRGGRCQGTRQVSKTYMNLARPTMLTLSLSVGGNGIQAQAPVAGGSDFVVGTYSRRADPLDAEPGLAAAIADLREAVSRRDASLVEPWLAAKVYWGDEDSAPKGRVVAEMTAARRSQH